MSTSRRDFRLRTIDLRTPPESGPDLSGSGGQGFFRAVLSLVAVAAVVGLALEAAVSVRRGEVPANELDYGFGSEDRPGGWRVFGPREGSGLRTRDVVLAIDGVPSDALFRSDSVRRRLDRRFRARKALHLELWREPSFSRRDFTAYQILIWRGNESGQLSRSVELDSARAGLGLEAAIRAFDPSDAAVCPDGPDACDSVPRLGVVPDDLDLGGAETALVTHAPALRSLPPGTELELGLRGDDVARASLAVTPPWGDAVQIERGTEGWRVVPTGVSTVRVEAMQRPWTASAEALAAHLLLLLIAVVGLLASRARTASPAVGHFVLLATAVGLPAISTAARAWERWSRPLSRVLSFGQETVAIPMRDGETWYVSLPGSEVLVELVVLGLVLGLALVAAARLLHDFPTPDPDLAARIGVPRRGLAIVVVLALVLTALFTRGWLDASPTVWQLRALLAGGTALFLWAFVMIVQVARLSRARLRQRHRGEEALQARIALFGLGLGAALILAAGAMPSWYRLSVPWSVPVYDAIEGTRSVVVPIGVALPFLGFFVAIARRGLWDVDVIIERATLLSILTGVFVLAWLGLEAAVEGILAGRLGGVPVLGWAAPPVLAGGLAAVSRHTVASALSHRLGPGGTPLGAVVESLTDATHEAEDPAALPGLIVDGLRDGLRPEHCALLLREGSGRRWRAWRAGGPVAAAPIVASVLDGLGEARHRVVVTPSGPSLVTRIDRGRETVGLLVLGMRRDGAFYPAEERRLLSLFLASVAPRLPVG